VTGHFLSIAIALARYVVGLNCSPGVWTSSWQFLWRLLSSGVQRRVGR